MTTWTVMTPSEGPEGLIADDWEIHPSGALIFMKDEGRSLRSLVIVYAPGSWMSFFQDAS